MRLGDNDAPAKGVHARQGDVLTTFVLPEYLIGTDRLRRQIATNFTIAVEVLREPNGLVQKILNT